MLNALIDGIAKQIHSIMGDDYTIYKEEVKQGLKEPSFMITHLISIDTAKLPNRYLRSNSFNIYYFPLSKTNAKEEAYNVGEQLLAGMEYITVEDVDNSEIQCRGTKMRYEFVDDVLHFFINYDMFVKKEKSDEVGAMEGLMMNESIVKTDADKPVTELTMLYATRNGNYKPQEPYTGFSSVDVDVPQSEPELTTLEITENGTYTPEQPYVGFESVTVEVNGGSDTFNTQLLLTEILTSKEVKREEEIVDETVNVLKRVLNEEN